MACLYFLKLANNKYYVGRTQRPVHQRLAEHFNGRGAQWTRLHKPVKLLKVKNRIDDFDEDKYTKVYMNKYGIDNVRGGSYIEPDLPTYQKMALLKELATAKNKCFKCLKTGHFFSKCPDK